MAYKPNSIGNMLKSIRTFLFNAVCAIPDDRERLKRENQSKSTLRYLDCAISDLEKLHKSINAQKSTKEKLQQAKNVRTWFRSNIVVYSLTTSGFRWKNFPCGNVSCMLQCDTAMMHL